MKEIKKDFMDKVRKAESADDIISLAGENGVDLGREQAEYYFDYFNKMKGELDDDELLSVSGGGCGSSSSSLSKSTDFRLGQTVTLRNNGHTFGTTASSTKCSNPACGGSVFYVLKKIPGTDYYLIECSKCKWTYNVLKENMVVV